jgi:putative phosphoesterase
MTLGLISDTHGHLDPKVARLFEGVEHILHAGDIGSWHIISELERLAPVTAVLGNNDYGLDARETEILELGGRRFFLHHIVTPHHPGDILAQRFQRVTPDVVLFGHTHKPFCEIIAGRLFVNPGYAGKPRFNLERTVALMELGEGAPQVRFVSLTS